MFVSINRLQIKPGSESILEERFAQSKGLDDMPGFIQFQLLKQVWNPHQNPDEPIEAIEFLAMTSWESEEHFRAWTQSEAFRKAHSGPKLDIFAGPGRPAGYEQRLHRQPKA